MRSPGQNDDSSVRAACPFDHVQLRERGARSTGLQQHQWEPDRKCLPGHEPVQNDDSSARAACPFDHVRLRERGVRSTGLQQHQWEPDRKCLPGHEPVQNDDSSARAACPFDHVRLRERGVRSTGLQQHQWEPDRKCLSGHEPVQNDDSSARAACPFDHVRLRSTSGSLTGNASQGTSLFKTTTPALKQPAPLTTSSFAFGAGPATTGTTIKFKILTGTDTMMKRVSITINTSYQCITCMKEYENKSLEELRLEDYAANRKGGQAGMVGFGATTQQSSIFSAPVSQQSGFNFGANQNKSLFGTSNTGTFTSTGGSIFSQNTQTQNVLGKTAGFGLPAQRTSSAFGTGTGFGTGTSVFGQPQQKSLLGQPAATGLFGQTAATTQASTGFGTGFGSTFEATTQASAFGVKQPFGVATTSAPSVFSFGSTANTGKQPAFTFQFTASTPFDTGTTGFGGFSTTPATGTGLFGAPKTTLSCGTGTTPAFGTTGFGTTGFGTTPPRTASTGTGLFGVNTAAKTTGFGFDTSTTGTSLAFGAGPARTGTTIKFKALTGTDYMMKNGVSSIINTSHQCITCMKEYENKSLEELRLEDYAANRKGGQAGMVGFGATTQQSSIFSVPVFQQSTFNFGADQSKSLIGTSNTGDSIFGQNTQTKATSFGLPAQPISTAFGTGTAFGTSTSVYGQSQQKANAFGGYSSLGVAEMYRRKVVCVKCSAEIQGREQPIHCSGTCQGTYHRRLI
ncbi:hypothetical protein ISCGN_028127 [Ixodes scapularis]